MNTYPASLVNYTLAPDRVLSDNDKGTLDSPPLS